MANPAKTNVVELNADELKRAAYIAGREAFLDKAAECGVNAGKGAQSPFELAMAFQDAIREGFATGSYDDAKLAVTAYRDGRKTVSDASALGIDKPRKDEKSIDTAAKNLATFGTACALAWGKALYSQIDGVISPYAAKDLGPGSKIHCYEKANRELNKLAVDKGMTVEQISGLANDAYFAAMLIKKDAVPEGEAADGDGADGENKKAAPKSAVEKLEAALKVLRKLAAEDFAGVADFGRATTYLNDFYHSQAKSK